MTRPTRSHEHVVCPQRKPRNNSLSHFLSLTLSHQLLNIFCAFFCITTQETGFRLQHLLTMEDTPNIIDPCVTPLRKRTWTPGSITNAYSAKRRRISVASVDFAREFPLDENEPTIERSAPVVSPSLCLLQQFGIGFLIAYTAGRSIHLNSSRGDSSTEHNPSNATHRKELWTC